MGFTDWNAFGRGVDATLIEQTAVSLVTSQIRAVWVFLDTGGDVYIDNIRAQ